MKLLRRNDNSYNRGNISHGEEMKHMRALSLIEELNARTRRETREDEGDRDEGDRRQGLDPKRLLCFSNKAKKDKNGETSRKKSPWRTRGIGEFDTGKTPSFEKERRNTGDLSDLCNELCQDYYEIRKKLRNRPIVLTTKKAQILEALAGSTSTSSSVDAPLRNFDEKISNRGEKKKTDFSNETIELHRRQRSLLDDNASVQSENNKSNGISIFNMKSKSKTFSRTKSSSKKSEKSDRSRRSQSRNGRSSRRKSNRDRSNRLRYAPPDIANSQSTEQTAPVSVIERKVRSGLDSSIISTITSTSYTTSGETDVIWSPRGAKEKVDKSSRASRKPKTKSLGLQVCAASPCASRSQSHLVSRNPSNVGTSPSNLRIIREGDDYSSSSDSSASTSSYGSSSSGSYSGSSYSDTGSEDEQDDLRIVYSSSYTKNSKSKKTKSVSSGCTTLAKDEIWNAIMNDDGNSIAQTEDFGDEERDDH